MEAIRTKRYEDGTIAGLGILVVRKKGDTCDYDKNCKNG
jgi:hypothetical protein